MGFEVKAMRKFLIWTMLSLAAFAGRIARADDWQEPPDKKFTEAELKTFLPCASEWVDQYSKLLKDAEHARTDAEKLAVLQNIDKKQKAVLADHHLSEAEFNWMQVRVTEAWTVMNVADKVLKNSEDQLKTRSQENETRMADAKTRLATFTAALKAGMHVLTSEDRDSAIRSAKDDEQTALDEVKQHVDDAAAAESEARQHDADAQAAEDLANHPPADVSADDRQAYVAGKKSDAGSARDAAKDARGRESDANKARLLAQAAADAAVQRAAHPELPLNDDDKAAAKADDDAGAITAKADIDSCKKTAASIADAQEQIQAMSAQFYKDVPPENVALLRKHYDEYKKVVDRQAAAATMPSR
jgi:hypothetical protein